MRRQTMLAGVADSVAVLVFVVLGRTSHDEGSWLGGVAATAGPFLVGAASGWLASAVLRWQPLRVRSGALVLAGTVGSGMVVRHLATGRAIPASFVVVATTVLAVFLLGWRALVARYTRSLSTAGS